MSSRFACCLQGSAWLLNQAAIQLRVQSHYIYCEGDNGSWWDLELLKNQRHGGWWLRSFRSFSLVPTGISGACGCPQVWCSGQGRGGAPLTLQGTVAKAPASLGAGPDPLQPSLHFNKLHRWFACTLPRGWGLQSSPLGWVVKGDSGPCAAARNVVCDLYTCGMGEFQACPLLHGSPRHGEKRKEVNPLSWVVMGNLAVGMAQDEEL